MIAIDPAATIWRNPRPSLEASLQRLPLVLLMHGKGSNEQIMFDRLPHLPLTTVVASIRAPYVFTTGWSWFPPSETPSWQRPAEQLRAAGHAIINWLDDVAPDAEIIPVGFSQGAAMAAELTRLMPERVRCAGVFSGFAHEGTEPRDQAATNVPVFVAHGDQDQVVPFAAGKRVAQLFDAPLRVMSGVGHVMAPEKINEFYAFAAEHIDQHH